MLQSMENIYWLIAGFVVLGVIALTTPAPSSDPTSPSQLPSPAQSFTLAQVALHDSVTSCYTVVGGQVFDLTQWINEHPGGEEAILSLCGVDGTAAFTKQHGSSEKAQKVLQSFFIGTVKN